MHGHADTAQPSAREAFGRFQQEILCQSPDLTPGLYAEDIVVEIPFARAGMPTRLEGVEQFGALARAGRAALPVRFEEFRDVTIYDTADPAVIIVEYELAGTVTTTNRSSSAKFIVVMSVDERGRITHWREYSDHQAIADALRPPDSPS